MQKISHLALKAICWMRGHNDLASSYGPVQFQGYTHARIVKCKRCQRIHIERARFDQTGERDIHAD